jgi:transcription termination/antitermination protein NusG
VKTLIDIEPNDGELVAEPHWYALHTRSRHEKRVRDELVVRPNVDPFLPLYRRFSWWGDRTKQVDVPLCSGYCFARFRYADRLPVLQTFGVVSVVGLIDRPEFIPDHEIEAIRALVESKLRYDPHPFLEEGDEVEVIRGPLKGTRGLLVRKDRAERVVLSVGLIRQAVAVEIHAADIARI